MKMSDIFNSIAHHDEAFEAETECPALVNFMVDAAGFEDVWVHHSGAHELHPAGVFAGATAFFLAEQAGEVEFEAGFNEGEIAWSEADFDLFFE